MEKAAAVDDVVAEQKKADAEKSPHTTPRSNPSRSKLEGGALDTPPKPCPRPSVAELRQLQDQRPGKDVPSEADATDLAEPKADPATPTSRLTPQMVLRP